MSQQIAQILVVDDDVSYCRMIEQYLSREGFKPVIAHEAEQMHAHLDQSELVLLDLHLPGTHGLDLARQIREKSPSIGIIVVTASNDEIDRIVGLEVGADDFVCKPFNERELLARIRSVLRRVNMTSTEGFSGLVFGDFRLDLETHSLMAGDEEIYLTGHEYNLLVMLAERPNRVFSREEISQRVSNREWFPDDRSVDVLVSKLRKKLEDGSEGGRLIKSLRGVGYQFSAKVDKT